MKTIKIIKKNGNRSIGVYQDKDGEYLAMTYGSSKTFKTLSGAKKWLKSRGYE